MPGFKILIFVDVGDPGDWALGLGVELATGLDASVVLLTTEGKLRQDPQLLERAEKRVRESTGREPASRIRPGAAREAIVAESLEVSPALSVFPPAGRRGLARMIRGSRVKKVVHTSPSTVVIARRPASDRIRRVLVTVSGGPMSETTILSAHEVVRALDAEMTVLHVRSTVTVPSSDREEPERPNPPVMADVSPLLENLDWGARGKPSLLIRRGMVVREILDECERGGYDLLILGQHLAVKESGGPLAADLARHLALECPLPVLIVRPRRWAAGARLRGD